MFEPSRAIARSGFSPARRAAMGISSNSRTKGARSLLWYSRNPLLTHSGKRVPAAINRHFIGVLQILSGARGALRYRRVPQLFEPVELAHARQHDVHDHLVQIDEHPIAVLFAFHTVRPKSSFFGFFDDPLRHRAHVPVRSTARDDHEIGDIGETSYVQ